MCKVQKGQCLFHLHITHGMNPEPPWLTQQKGFFCIADQENTKRWPWGLPDGPHCSLPCHIPSLQWVYSWVLVGSHVSLTLFLLLVPCTIPTDFTPSYQFPARKTPLQWSAAHHIIADSLTWPKHTKPFYCLRAKLGGAMCSLAGCAQGRNSPEQCGHWSIPLVSGSGTLTRLGYLAVQTWLWIQLLRASVSLYMAFTHTPTSTTAPWWRCLAKSTPPGYAEWKSADDCSEGFQFVLFY